MINYDQLALKANQATTYTKTEVDNLLTPKATVTYVNDQLALKANQATTYTKTEAYNLLATTQPTITSATNLTVNTLTATKLISNSLEVVGITDQITIKSNWVILATAIPILY